MTRQGCRGSILVLVLWIVSLLAVFSVALAQTARQRAMLLDRLVNLDGLSAAAFAGIERAKNLIIEDIEDSNDSFEDPWASNRLAFAGVSVGDAAFDVKYRVHQNGLRVDHYGVTDESRKINLNTADAAIIARLIEYSADLDSDVAEELAYSIVDWRDGDAAYGHARYGAEDTDYDDLRYPYACKDAPYESLDELLLIKGMTRAIFDTIKDYVTAYGENTVNINTASKSVLMALGMDSELADKIIRYRSGRDGKPGGLDDVIFLDPTNIINVLNRDTPALSGFQQTILTNLLLAEKVGTSSGFFLARSYGRSKAGATIEVQAVIDRQGKTVYSKSSGVQWPSKVSNLN